MLFAIYKLIKLCNAYSVQGCTRVKGRIYEQLGPRGRLTAHWGTATVV